MYGVKSTLILIDTIGMLADTVREGMARRYIHTYTFMIHTYIPYIHTYIHVFSEYTALYLPKIVEKFDELEDNDMRLIPIFEVPYIHTYIHTFFLIPYIFTYIHSISVLDRFSVSLELKQSPS